MKCMMLNTSSPSSIFELILLILISTSGRICSINIKRIDVPPVAKAGNDVSFTCAFDIMNSKLYSIKWFKDDDEFYRFRPKTEPNLRLFNAPGVQVDLSRSRYGNIVLKDVNLSSSGSYKCEGAEDKPTFAAISIERTLEVVVLPKRNPLIHGGRRSYAVGDVVKKKCTMAPSSPPANIRWFINRVSVPQRKTRRYQSITTENKLHQTISGMKFVVEDKHFNESGFINITCQAKIFDIYKTSVWQFIAHHNHSQSQSATKFNDDHSYWNSHQHFSSTNIGMAVHQANSIDDDSNDNKKNVANTVRTGTNLLSCISIYVILFWVQLAHFQHLSDGITLVYR